MKGPNMADSHAGTLTASLEDDLEAIAQVTVGKQAVRPKDIGKPAAVSISSVTHALGEFAEGG